MGCLAYDHLWQIEHVKEEEILYDFAVRLFYSDKIQVPSHSGVYPLWGQQVRALYKTSYGCVNDVGQFPERIIRRITWQ